MTDRRTQVIAATPPPPPPAIRPLHPTPVTAKTGTAKTYMKPKWTECWSGLGALFGECVLSSLTRLPYLPLMNSRRPFGPVCAAVGPSRRVTSFCFRRTLPICTRADLLFTHGVGVQPAAMPALIHTPSAVLHARMAAETPAPAVTVPATAPAAP